MTTSAENKITSQRFLESIFRVRDEKYQSSFDFFEKWKADSSQADILKFTQSLQAEVFTAEYLKNLHALWNELNHGSQIMPQKTDPGELPDLAAMPTKTASESLPDASAPTEPVKLPGMASEAASTPIVAPPISQNPVANPPVPSHGPHQPSKPRSVPVSVPRNKNDKLPSVKLNFHIPNAKVGESFEGLVAGQDALSRRLKIWDVTIDPKIGLTFDQTSCELRGVPVIAGNHKINIQWTMWGGGFETTEFILIVNPDPKTLWKNIEPPLPADDPYFKKNTDGAIIIEQDFKIVAASRRGRSHEHVGSSRDDDFFIQSDTASGWSILVVADGAGSAKHSRWGSWLAVQEVGKHIYSKITAKFGRDMSHALAGWSEDMQTASKALNPPFYLLFQEASKLAVEAIEKEAKDKGALPKDYSTTLLVAVTKREGDKTFLATFWMGDGAIAAYGPRGKVRLMGSPDGGEFAGQTRFLDRAALTDPNFGKRVSIGRYTGLESVILMTDGVSDPRFETDNGLADPSKWDSLWDEVKPHLDAAEPHTSLIEWLHFFSPGNHDDRTISILW